MRTTRISSGWAHRRGGRVLKELKTIGLAILILIGLAVLGTLTEGLTSSHKALSTPERIAQETRALVDPVDRIVYEIKSEFVGQLQEMRSLKEFILNAEDKQAILPEVASRMKGLTEAFERLAERSSRAQAELANNVQLLQLDLPQASDHEIDRLMAEKARLEGRIETLQQNPTLENQIKIGASRARIKALERQIKFWQDFHKVQQAVGQHASNTYERIRLLFVLAQENAPVFREYLHLIELYRDLNAALKILEAIPDIEQLIQEVMASWQSLDEMVDVLEEQALQWPVVQQQ